MRLVNSSFEFSTFLSSLFGAFLLYSLLSFELAFKRYPSLKAKARDRENIQTAWEVAVSNLIRWFEKPRNYDLAKKYFGRIPTEKDFPKDCPYTFEQMLEYKPWLKDRT